MKFIAYPQDKSWYILTDDYTQQEIDDGTLFQNLKKDIEPLHITSKIIICDDNLTPRYVM